MSTSGGSATAKRTSGRRQKTESTGTLDEDGSAQHFEHGSWECTVCTYRNRPESFRCEICDVRKGTSTRKPRLNSTVVEQQQTVQKFVQQQQMAMIAQAHKEKNRGERNSLCGSSTSTRDVDSPGPSSNRSLESPTNSCSSTTRLARSPSAPPSSDTPTPHLTTCSSPVNNQLNSSVSEMSPPVLFPAPTSSSAPLSPDNTGCSTLPLDITGCSMQSAVSTPRKDRGRKSINNKKTSVSSSDDNHNNNSNDNNCGDNDTDDKNNDNNCSPGDTTANNTTKSGGKKMPTRKNITKNFFRNHLDQNSARTLAVTVNGITVVITDYKLLHAWNNFTGSNMNSNNNSNDRSITLVTASTNHVTATLMNHHQQQLGSHETLPTAAASTSLVNTTPKIPRMYTKLTNSEKAEKSLLKQQQQQQQQQGQKDSIKKRRRKSADLDNPSDSSTSINILNTTDDKISPSSDNTTELNNACDERKDQRKKYKKSTTISLSAKKSKTSNSATGSNNNDSNTTAAENSNGRSTKNGEHAKVRDN